MTMPLPPPSPSRALLLGALALLSASTLMFEVLLTKLFANKLDHHFTFAIISIALLGFGASGVWVHARGRLFASADAALPKRLAKYSAAYSASVPLSIALFVLLPLDPSFPGWFGALAMPLYFALFASVFFLAGVCISAMFVAPGLRPSLVYFWDLSGAAIGAAAGPWVLARCGAYGAITVASSLAWGACLLLNAGERRGALRRVAVSTAATLAGALLLFAAPGWLRRGIGFDIVSFKAAEVKREFALFGPAVQTYWNAVARIDVSPTGTSEQVSFRYGIPRRLWSAPLRGRMILVDGGANSRQYVFDDLAQAAPLLKSALWAAPYVLRGDARRSLIIGPGGGIDILIGRLHGVREIDALELNPDMYALLIGRPQDPERAAYTRWLGSDGKTRVTVHNAEARHWAHASRRVGGYDVVLASGVDTLTAVQTAGNALTENFLYTREAVQDYVRLVEPGGMIALTHWHLEPPTLALKMFLTYLQVLEQRGIEDPGRHVAVVSEGFWENAILKPGAPFTEEEVARLRAFAAEGGFDIVFDPLAQAPRPGARDSNRLFAAIGHATRSQRAALIASLPMDMEPASDDRPYFYWTPTRDGGGTVFDSVFLHPSIRGMFFLGLVLAGAMVVVPAIGMRKRREPVRGALAALPVFAASGLAFIIAENALFLQLTLYVGGPLYSLAVVLPSLLAGYAGGSLVATRFGTGRRGAAGIGLALTLGFGGIAWVLTRGLPAWIGFSDPLRLGIAVALVVPFGALLGLVVPWTMEGMKARGWGSALPWMWAVSSAANTLGSLLFVPVCRETGVRMMFAVSAVLYGASLVWAAFAPALVRHEGSPDEGLASGEDHA